MGKLRQTALILSEGPTEFFYFKSLWDVFKRPTIKPDYPKHTNIKELEAKIVEGVAMGFSHIFCIIDMDTKDKEPERSQYQKLKAKYANPINKPKKGIYCEVEFFETHRCTEQFFLYYFRYTSRPYNEQETLLKDLNQCVEYRKTIDFFIKTKGLHGYFERNGGSFEKAVGNANRSMYEKLKTGSDYTYSELGRLIERLVEISLFACRTGNVKKNNGNDGEKGINGNAGRYRFNTQTIDRQLPERVLFAERDRGYCCGSSTRLGGRRWKNPLIKAFEMLTFDLKALFRRFFGCFSLKSLWDRNKSITFIATNSARFP